MKITLGHSPDPDDAFMFYALADGKIDTGSYAFEHVLQDIQTLNERAHRTELDVTAVSIYAYAFLAKDYALLSSGASMGDNYGPLIVAKNPMSRERIAAARIAIPGKLTSAWLALQLWLRVKGEDLNAIVVPFDRIQETVLSGQADAGLLIHEGQLTYVRDGLQLCVDLGQWWFEETEGLPLPLGGNAIRRALGAEVIADISRLLRESIAYGLKHRAEGISHALPLGRGLDRAQADRFIAMYVNELTLDYGERGRRAVREFFERGRKAGLVPEIYNEFTLDFV